MNPLEATLLNTRKTVLAACGELGYNYPNESEINLIACSSCGLWLKKMKNDNDGLPICNPCINEYGM